MKRILIVDDEMAVARVLQRTLSVRGYVASTFTSPLEALKVIRAEPESVLAVVCDYEMPGMRGDEFAQLVKATAPIPVVLLTGAPVDLDVDLSIFDAVRLKPISAQMLVLALEKVMGRQS